MTSTTLLQLIAVLGVLFLIGIAVILVKPVKIARSGGLAAKRKVRSQPSDAAQSAQMPLTIFAPELGTLTDRSLLEKAGQPSPAPAAFGKSRK